MKKLCLAIALLAAGAPVVEAFPVARPRPALVGPRARIQAAKARIKARIQARRAARQAAQNPQPQQAQ